MRKNEIKPGVIYAYQRGRGYWDTPTPIVFLASTDVLFAEGSPYRKADAPTYFRAAGDSKPRAKSGFNGRDWGYAAVRADFGHDIDPQDLLKPTLAEFEATTSGLCQSVEGARFTLVTSLATITGLYDEVLAEYQTRQDADRRQREQDQARRDAVHARSADIISQLARFGAEPVSAGTSCTRAAHQTHAG